jgi:hypothetical protein
MFRLRKASVMRFGDADSDGEDFLIWQRNFGIGVLSAATAVPEPAAGLLGMIGLMLVVSRPQSGRCGTCPSHAHQDEGMPRG